MVSRLEEKILPIGPTIDWFVISIVSYDWFSSVVINLTLANAAASAFDLPSLYMA